VFIYHVCAYARIRVRTRTHMRVCICACVRESVCLCVSEQCTCVLHAGEIMAHVAFRKTFRTLCVCFFLYTLCVCVCFEVSHLEPHSM